MTKNVLIKVCGMQMEINQSENIEITTVGKYYKKEGKHYIFYDEIIDCNQPPVKNSIKIYDDKVEISKKGGTNTQMFFETGKKNTSMYNTPFGAIEIGICAHEIHFEEAGDEIMLALRYDLEMNGEHVSDSQIYMQVAATA